MTISGGKQSARLFIPLISGILTAIIASRFLSPAWSLGAGVVAALIVYGVVGWLMRGE